MGTSPHVVVLVPWRPSDPERQAAWEFSRTHLESFGWPIFVADSRGPWNRSEAINRASREAGDWDVAVIADADTIHLPDELWRAVAWAAKLNGVVVPWRTRWKLSIGGSNRFMQTGVAGFNEAIDLDPDDRTRVRMPIKQRGGTTVVARSAWDLLGGFDEGFVGWGHEDVAFRIAASTLAKGKLVEILGTIWHLYHSRDLNHPTRTDNDRRKDRYLRADGSRVKMLALLQELELV